MRYFDSRDMPIEVMFDDRPRRDAVILAVQLRNSAGDEPESDSHIERQQQIHRLRHVVRELEKHLPAARKPKAPPESFFIWP